MRESYPIVYLVKNYVAGTVEALMSSKNPWMSLKKILNPKLRHVSKMTSLVKFSGARLWVIQKYILMHWF